MFLLLLFVNFESHLSKHVNCTSIKVVQENLYTCYFKTPNTCLIEAASHIVVHDSDRIGPIQLKFTQTPDHWKGVYATKALLHNVELSICQGVINVLVLHAVLQILPDLRIKIY